MSDFLLVDDDAAFSRMLMRVLLRRGFSVACAANGSDALQQAMQLQPARIVLDLNLGGDSGLKLLPQLREAAPDAAIVVLTGYASIATAVEAIKLGAIQYLAKPAAVEAILAAFGQQAANPDLALAEMPMSLKRISWEHLQRVLAEHEGNVSATARSLKMHRRTLQRMLAKRPVAG
ncbi:response regulator [Rhodobacteraceae bacterium CH30]|nr:response regulator [Rhodobacteraceae bacterium CH30]